MNTHFLPAGFGAFDVTSFPFGGDFIRPAKDVPVRNVRPSEKPGWSIAECEYPNRRGARTVCSQHLQETPPVHPAAEPENVLPALAEALAGLGAATPRARG